MSCGSQAPVAKQPPNPATIYHKQDFLLLSINFSWKIQHVLIRICLWSIILVIHFKKLTSLILVHLDGRYSFAPMIITAKSKLFVVLIYTELAEGTISGCHCKDLGRVQSALNFPKRSIFGCHCSDKLMNLIFLVKKVINWTLIS